MNKETFTFQGMQYLVVYPDGYKSTEKYPLLIQLHGAGSRGTDPGVLVKSVFLAGYESQASHPFIVVMPLCHANTWFDLFETLKAFVGMLCQRKDVDVERVYLSGASMGGYAAWQLAMSLPEVFAALVPVCGGGMYWNAARLEKVPVWAFHGGKDNTVLPRESEIMVEKIRLKGGEAKLTVYPENGHNAWTDTYYNPEVYQWLLSHRKQEQGVGADEYTDAVKFG